MRSFSDLMSQVTDEEAGIKPFHQWKTDQLKADSRVREREWYQEEYKGYCLQRRRVAAQKKILLEELGKSDFVYFDDRFKLGQWSKAISELKEEGKVKVCMNEIEEQYSRLEIRLK